MRYLALLLAPVLVLALLAGCSRPQPTNGEVKMTVMARAREVATAFRDRDMAKLAIMVHPDKGVRFSPYSFVRTGQDGDVVLTANEVRLILADSRSFTWGVSDGKGDPIVLGFWSYVQGFVYDRDFLAAPVVEFNKVVMQGNTVVNITDAYPDGLFVEFHFPGTEQYSGYDWDSLRLVFEQKGKTWYLVGVVHDQWTI